MTDEGTWHPPDPGSGPTPPPPPGPPSPPPGPGSEASSGSPTLPPPSPGPTPPEASLTTTETDTEPEPAGGKGKLIALVVGVAVLVAAGVFALTRLVGGDSTAGGAETPEEAGLALMGALENEDVLGMIDVLLPGERETFRDPVSDLADELRRLELLSSDATLSDVGGFDVVFESEDAATEPTNVEDIVNLRLSGAVSVSVDGEALPIGDLIFDNVPDVDPAEADVPPSDPEPFELPLTAVREGDRWYVSLFHTVAELARQEADVEIPAEGITPVGGDSPEDAFDVLLDGIEALDLSQIIGSMNPEEFQALQRYAPAFIGEAQAELDAAGIDITLDDAEYTVGGGGDQRSITVSYLSGAISAEGDTVTFEFEDGCLKATGVDPSQTFDSCELQGGNAEDIFGTDAELVNDLATTLGDALGDYENPGIIVKQVDGTWYLSPFATGSEQVLAFLGALDRSEIDSIIDEISSLADDVVTGVNEGGGVSLPGGLSDDPGADQFPVPETIVPDETLEPVDTVPGTFEEGAPEDTTESDAGDECYAAQTATDAVDCFDALLATGEISPSSVPVYLRADECGLAGPFWTGDYYSLSDAEFTAAVAEAAPCFQGLVADGTLDEFDLPLELSNPECLEDRNWYGANDDDEYFDRVFECAYG